MTELAPLGRFTKTTVFQPRCRGAADSQRDQQGKRLACLGGERVSSGIATLGHLAYDGLRICWIMLLKKGLS